MSERLRAELEWKVVAAEEEARRRERETLRVQNELNHTRTALDSAVCELGESTRLAAAHQNNFLAARTALANLQSRLSSEEQVDVSEEKGGGSSALPEVDVREKGGVGGAVDLPNLRLAVSQTNRSQ